MTPESDARAWRARAQKVGLRPVQLHYDYHNCITGLTLNPGLVLQVHVKVYPRIKVGKPGWKNRLEEVFKEQLGLRPISWPQSPKSKLVGAVPTTVSMVEELGELEAEGDTTAFQPLVDSFGTPVF